MRNVYYSVLFTLIFIKIHFRCDKSHIVMSVRNIRKHNVIINVIINYTLQLISLYNNIKLFYLIKNNLHFIFHLYNKLLL